MSLGPLLRTARQRAGLTQRSLAERSGVAQPTIARFERGVADVRVATLERLLEACGLWLRVEEAPTGAGVDRSQIRELLAESPRRRLELLRSDAAALDRFEKAARR